MSDRFYTSAALVLLIAAAAGVALQPAGDETVGALGGADAVFTG